MARPAIMMRGVVMGCPVIDGVVMTVISTILLTIEIGLCAIVRLVVDWIWLVVDPSHELIFAWIGVFGAKDVLAKC